MPSDTFINRIRAKWLNLIGDAESFPMEARIFHSISVGLLLLAAVYAPYNFFEGLYVGSVSIVVIAFFLYYQYYNSRFKGRTHNNVFFALMGVAVFAINYFSNSGINGSTDIIMPAYLLFVLAISPYKQHLLWVTLYIATFLALHIVEYNYPELVKHPFDMGKGQFIDRITAFPMPVIVMAITIAFIKRSYNKERAAVEERSATIALRNEQISQQKAELEKGNAEKNKLLSIISHDMRAPFSAIQGYLQLLNDNKLDSKERTTVEGELLITTDRTVEMLSNLLYWSRSQMHGSVVDLVNADLLSTLDKTIAIEKTIAAKKGIELKHQVAEGISVIADVNMLQLVVRNIISNAIKFTRPGGIINVDARVLNNECKISIRDNGVGIEPAKQATLFSMSSGATFGTNNEKGVGLGLPLCKEFMELQGGRVEFESAVGKGSGFFVFIPLA